MRSTVGRRNAIFERAAKEKCASGAKFNIAIGEVDPPDGSAMVLADKDD
jgi:hypothetical protein